MQRLGTKLSYPMQGKVLYRLFRIKHRYFGNLCYITAAPVLYRAQKIVYLFVKCCYNQLIATSDARSKM